MDLNFAASSSNLVDDPCSLSSMASLTFALNSCLARSGSLAAILFGGDFFVEGVRVAEECDLDMPCWRVGCF